MLNEALLSHAGREQHKSNMLNGDENDIPACSLPSHKSFLDVGNASGAGGTVSIRAVSEGSRCYRCTSSSLEAEIDKSARKRPPHDCYRALNHGHRTCPVLCCLKSKNDM